MVKQIWKWTWLQCQRSTLLYKSSVHASTLRSHHCWLHSRANTTLDAAVPVIAAKMAKASHLASFFLNLLDLIMYSWWAACQPPEQIAMQAWASRANIHLLLLLQYDGHFCWFVDTVWIIQNWHCCTLVGHYDRYASLTVTEGELYKTERVDLSKNLNCKVNVQ